jgi:hypothetical protein
MNNIQDEINNGLIAKVGAEAFCVYLAIKTQTDEVTGEQPSLNLLSTQLGMSLEAVYIHSTKLVTAGFLSPR